MPKRGGWWKRPSIRRRPQVRRDGPSRPPGQVELGLHGLLQKFAFGNIATLGDKENDVPVFVHYRLEGKVYVYKAPFRGGMGGLEMDEPSLGCILDGVTQPLLLFLRMGPPGGLPERFADYLGFPPLDEIEGRPVNFNKGPVGLQKAHQLRCLIEDNAQERLAVPKRFLCPLALQFNRSTYRKDRQYIFCSLPVLKRFFAHDDQQAQSMAGGIDKGCADKTFYLPFP